MIDWEKKAREFHEAGNVALEALQDALDFASLHTADHPDDPVRIAVIQHTQRTIVRVRKTLTASEN
jgi:hypothetical protein